MKGRTRAVRRDPNMTNNFLPMFTWCSYTLVAVVVTVVVLAFFLLLPWLDFGFNFFHLFAMLVTAG